LGWPGDREVLIFAGLIQAPEFLEYEKAGLAPAFLFTLICCDDVCERAPKPASQQSVDGLWGTLEIRRRSSYVPNSPIGVRSRFPEDARRYVAPSPRLEMPIWMK